MSFSPGPQPTYTSSQGDDPDWTPPPPAGFTAAQVLASAREQQRRIREANLPEPILWEGDNA